MILSNFNFNAIHKRRYWDTAYAWVDVTAGWWIFKTTKTMAIEATVIGGQTMHWEFVETGLCTPGHQAEALYEEYLNETK